ncbi:hypothetical protein J2Y03_002072 [Neobacillus niacini]|uniref:hypothetical protein n=1 Tax=Neobacillus niacini TaxID=86668 RepID=UPI0028543DF4|nr:hypothetical protein [Neobacillus niacini]MDR7077049.1 hypothetical protein [Neobacillus niacini]
MLKLIIFVFFVLLSVTLLFLILTNKRQQIIQTYSLSAFLGASSEDDMQESKQSLIEKVNEFFGDNTDETNDGDGDIDGDGGGDDGGE